jgi:Na+-driven multidrug efflux pump
MITDDRGSATSIARLFLGLIVGAIVIWIVGLVADPVLSQASEQSSATVATTGTDYLQAGVDFFPIFILFVSFFGLIAYAVYRREVVG